MLPNATLLTVNGTSVSRADDGGPARCAVGTPTRTEADLINAMALHASVILYLSLGAVSMGSVPATGQTITLQLDGCPVATFTVASVAERMGNVLSHFQIFLVLA